MNDSAAIDKYGTTTFVDPSDEQAVARLFNYPLVEGSKLPENLLAAYVKLYNAHQRVLLQLAAAKSELAATKEHNEKLNQRLQQAIDQTEHLLIILKGLKEEQEWDSDNEDVRSESPTSNSDIPQEARQDKVDTLSLPKIIVPEATKTVEQPTISTPSASTPAGERVKHTHTLTPKVEEPVYESPLMKSRHAPKSPGLVPPHIRNRSPHDIIKHHLGISNKAQSTPNGPVSTAPSSSSKEKQADGAPRLPPPPARQKTVYCHCFTNCWDKNAEICCSCRKAHEPCDVEKCHKPPKRVWLPWGNSDGTPCDCRWTGNSEEEIKYGYPENRLLRWLNGKETF